MTLFSTTLSSHSVNASTVACLRRISLNSLKTVKEQEPYFSYRIISKYGVNYNNMNYSIAIVEKDIACNKHIEIKLRNTHTRHSVPDLTPRHHWCCEAHACLYCSDQCCPRQQSSGSPSGRHTARGGPSVSGTERRGILKFQVQQSNKKGVGVGGGGHKNTTIVIKPP